MAEAGCSQLGQLYGTDVWGIVVFVEAPLFTRLVSRYMGDDEYCGLQWSLVLNPNAGKLIRGSGGIRKLRWTATGRGKRGGLRIVYYLRTRDEIWLLSIYAKNEAQDLSAEILRALRKEIER